jgi:outer membrane translocation and assembly module TamA
MGAPEGSQPPVNVLFYPGGDGSIRGYKKDEAAPRSPTTGKFIGAKTYTQINVELEQALTRKWTAVAFFDAVGTAVRLEEYPASEELYSVGVGVRYQTVVGPIRLEYGYNLNPRPFDPSGTVLFSVGFPF